MKVRRHNLRTKALQLYTFFAVFPLEIVDKLLDFVNDAYEQIIRCLREYSMTAHTFDRCPDFLSQSIFYTSSNAYEQAFTGIHPAMWHLRHPHGTANIDFMRAFFHNVRTLLNVNIQVEHYKLTLSTNIESFMPTKEQRAKVEDIQIRTLISGQQPDLMEGTLYDSDVAITGHCNLRLTEHPFVDHLGFKTRKPHHHPDCPTFFRTNCDADLNIQMVPAALAPYSRNFERKVHVLFFKATNRIEQYHLWTSHEPFKGKHLLTSLMSTRMFNNLPQKLWITISVSVPIYYLCPHCYDCKATTGPGCCHCCLHWAFMGELQSYSACCKILPTQEQVLDDDRKLSTREEMVGVAEGGEDDESSEVY